MAVPVDLIINSESSDDEDFSDSEISYSSEDEAMEDEPSESENTNGRKTEPNRSEEEFWARYPYLKNFLGTIVAQGLIPEYYAFERAKLIGDDKVKELNEKCEALSIKELELCSMKCEFIADAISVMKSAK